MRNKILIGISLVMIALSAALGQTVPQVQCVSNAQAGGTPDAITVPLLPCGLATNLLLLTLSGSNTSSSPTLQMVGFPALPIVNASGAPVQVGALPGAGAVVLLSGTGSKWILLSNGTGSPIGGSGLASVDTIAVTGGQTVSLTQSNQIVVIAATDGSNTTVNLPPISDWPDCPIIATSCPVITIKNGTGASDDGTITIATVDGTKIDNATTASEPFSGQSQDYFLEGSQWGIK